MLLNVVFNHFFDLICIVSVSFENIKIAFSNKSNTDLNSSYLVFKLMSSPVLVKIMTRLTVIALKLNLPIKGIIRATAFKQFCGGESISDCETTIETLKEVNVKTILDYSVEGEQSEKDFDSTKNEILRIVELAKTHKSIPVTCVKLTGLFPLDILQKRTENKSLSNKEVIKYEAAKNRLSTICAACFNANIPIYIDAEESWIQEEIDNLAENMMREFNSNKVIVFTTIQMYRHDRLNYFKNLIEEAKQENFKIGIKIVRGAYLEQENIRAQQKNYPTPIQASKKHTDSDYNTAVKLAIENINIVEVCVGTHNEKSCMDLIDLMREQHIDNNHPNIYFSQLFGMSDHISYNLANDNYNVSKYLPYGPIKDTMPYLIRRAEENTSIAGQVGKELSLVIREKKRRKSTVD